MQAVVEGELRRAVRDNECVYMVRVPAPETLPPLGAAAVVKAVPPPRDALAGGSLSIHLYVLCFKSNDETL
jgi:programmed cell death 6-interacting protein